MYEEGKLISEDTGEVFDASGAESIVARLFSEPYIAVVETFTDKHFPLDYFVRDDNSTVICSKKGSITAIRIHRSRYARWIVRAGVWGGHAVPEFIKYMREFYEYVNIGFYPTPSSLGSAYMQQSWAANEFRRHVNVNGFARGFLRRYMVGGRADTPGIGNFYEEADSYDMVLAHLSEYACQPTGTVCAFTHGRGMDRYVDWFAEVEVTIHSELALGPFPIRLGNRKLKYPTLPGKYKTALWKGRAEDAIAAGCTVELVGDGYGWNSITNDTMAGARGLFRLRQNAPTDAIRKSVKGIINPAIGRHGSNGENYELILAEKAVEGDNELVEFYNGHGVAMGYAVHKVVQSNMSNMIHWYSHTVDQTSRKLYKFALPFAEQGRLVATNYDGILTTDGERPPTLYRYDEDAILAPPGTWLWEPITNLNVIAARTWESDQMSSAPGRKKSGIHA